jgi:hypothetical protein
MNSSHGAVTPTVAITRAIASRTAAIAMDSLSLNLSIFELGTSVGRSLIGFASDRLGRIEVAGSSTLFCGLI